MHALMALFFYELVCDQSLILIFYKCVGLRCGPLMTIVPAFSTSFMMNNAPIDQVMSDRFYCYLFIYRFMCLFICVLFKIRALIATVLFAL